MLFGSLFLTVLSVLSAVAAVKFELQAVAPSKASYSGPFCLSLYIGNDVLVSGIIKATLRQQAGTGVNRFSAGSANGAYTLDASIGDAQNNVAWSKRAIPVTTDDSAIATKLSFRTHQEPRDYNICFLALANSEGESFVWNQEF